MAVNLSSVATQLLTPDVTAKIASFLGVDRSAAQKAAEATIPTILASLSDLVETPAGANQLSKLLTQQQGGNPVDLLHSSGAQGLAQMGSNMLSGLFGGRTIDTLAQAIGRLQGRAIAAARRYYPWSARLCWVGSVSSSVTPGWMQTDWHRFCVRRRTRS